MKMQLLSFVCVILVFSCVQCSNILAIFNAPSKSHTILGVKLSQGLIKRGHHVTLISPYETKPMENFTSIHLKSIVEFKDRSSLAMDLSKGKNPISMFFQTISFFRNVISIFWEEPAIQKIIKEKPKYDVVVMVSFFNDALLALPHHLGVPSIFFSPLGASNLVNKYAANPNMVYIPNHQFVLPTNTFYGRLTAVTVNCLMDVATGWLLGSTQEEIVRKYLPNSPPLEELKKNVSLMLMNSHFSIEPARPYVPNMIQIGGFHVQDTNELPKDIKNYLDSAKQGAILFSLGSNVLISAIDEKKRDGIFKVLGEMAPMKVLFKSEMDHKNIPDNVVVKKWLPQADILAHSNLKVFISHGGLGGTTESVYHGVPMLGIPFFGDQRMNMEEAKAAGYAVVLMIEELTEETFREKLKEVLENSKYTENAKKRSALMKEQPVKPMDNAAFWIEHIIKYGGGSHLRNAGMDLTWYQLYMVDIYVFYTLLLCLILCFNYFVIKFSIKLTRRLFCKNNSKVKTS